MGDSRPNRPKRLYRATRFSRWSWVSLLAVIGGTLAFGDHMPPAVLSTLLSAGVLQRLAAPASKSWPVKRTFALGMCEQHLGRSNLLAQQRRRMLTGQKSDWSSYLAGLGMRVITVAHLVDSVSMKAPNAAASR